MAEDDIGQMEYIPARKMRKPEEQPKKQGIASKLIGTAKGVGGFVKREVQGEFRAGIGIARASPRLAERAIISGAREAKAGTEVAGWVAGKEAGFREWQARREAENQRRANVISGLTFGGQARQPENPFATRHLLESLPISWQLPSMHSNSLLKTAGKRSRGKKHKHHSKGRKITFTDSRGKKISFMVKR